MTALATFTIREFCAPALQQGLPDILEERFKAVLDKNGPSEGEKASWAKSLPALAALLAQQPIDGHVLIEYPMPLGNRRADCLLIGQDTSGRTHIIVVELKQWSQGSVSLKQSFDMGWLTVNAYEPYPSDHPCEQANVYRTALEELLDFGPNPPQVHALAFLHEYSTQKDDVLLLPQFEEHLTRSTLCTRDVGQTQTQQLLQLLQGSSPALKLLADPRLRYSGAFIANFSDKLNCSALFEPTPEQVQAFQDVAAAVDKLGHTRSCVIVKGIVGTGKTVLAMLLVRHLMERNLNPKYVVRSAAIKDCVQKLDFHVGGAACTQCLVVDEAHRLSRDDLRGLMLNKQLAVFFVDDNQWLHPDETCRSVDIRQTAARLGLTVVERTLSTQLRCQDAHAYIRWIDEFINQGQLQQLNAAEGFEVRLVDTPKNMDRMLKERAKQKHSCRILAGYCWPWRTQNTPGRGHDIEIGDWKARWNAAKLYAEWNREPGMHEEVGAIFTVQGFEYDYVGVVIGADLAYSDQSLRVRPAPQEYPALKKYRNRESVPLDERKKNFARAIRNIYYVLLTRAKKGVFIYAVDQGLQAELEKVLPRAVAGLN